MITTEIIMIGTRQFQKTISDTYMIRQIETGNIYQEAVDILPCSYTYEETDIPLPSEEEENNDVAECIIEELGSINNPINYNGNMILQTNKYYLQEEKLYLCNKSSEFVIYHPLSELVGIYVEEVK